jgi:hypothetical protein
MFGRRRPTRWIKCSCPAPENWSISRVVIREEARITADAVVESWMPVSIEADGHGHRTGEFVNSDWPHRARLIWPHRRSV